MYAVKTLYNKPANETTTVRTSSVTSSRQSEMYTTQACTRDGDQLIHSQCTVWSAVTSTPTSAQRQRRSDLNRDAGRSASVGDSDLHPDDNDQPLVVTTRKRRRQGTNGEQTQIVGTNSVARSQTRRGPLVVGNSTSSNSRRVSAAASYPPNTYVERSVFCIDNVAPKKLSVIYVSWRREWMSEFYHVMK